MRSRRLTLQAQRTLLANIARILGSSPRVEDVFADLAAVIRPALPWDRIVIAIADLGSGSSMDAYVAGVEIQNWTAGAGHPLSGSLTERVIAYGRPFVLQAPTAEALAALEPALATGVDAGLRSALSVPLFYRGHPYGAMHLRSAEANAYKPTHVKLAIEIANQVAGGIANSWLLREVERDARERTLLAELGQILTSSESLADLYGTCAKKIHELIPWDAFAIALVDTESGTMTNAYIATPQEGESVHPSPMPLAGTLSERVITENQPALISARDPAALLERLGRRVSVLSDGMSSAIAVPLRSGGVPFGVMHLRSRSADAYLVPQLRFAERIADQISGSIANGLQLQRAKRDAHERSVLAEISRLTLSSQDIEQALTSITSLLREVVSFDRFDVSVLDRDGEYRKAFITGVPMLGWGQDSRHRAGGTVTSFVLETGRPLLIRDLDGPEGRPIATRDVYLSAGLRSVLAVPLYHQGRTTGVLQFVSRSPSAFETPQGSFAERAAAYLAPALEQSRLLADTRAAMRLAVENEAHLQSVLDSSRDAILTVDADGRIITMNSAASQMFGVRGKPSAPSSLAAFAASESSERLLALLVATQAPDFDTTGTSSEFELNRLEGGPFPAEVSIAPVRSSNPPRYVVTVRDITVRRMAERNLELLATTDYLTGLTNRYQFGALLRHAVQFAGRRGTTGALLYIDLDNFKYVNDTYGHTTGDRLLKAVAEALRDGVRASDTVARTGGDEFSIVLQDIDEENATRKARELIQRVSAVKVMAGADPVSVTASCGTVMFPQQGKETSLDDLIAFADMGMYMAKESGRGAAYLYRPDVENRSDRTSLQRTRLMIVDALEHGRVVLHRQPIVDLKTGHAPIWEVLVRLKDSEGRTRMPGEFIVQAENLDLIQLIDRAVLARVFRWQRDHANTAGCRVLAVNVSPRTLGQDFVEWTKTMAEEYRVAPERIHLEITETAAMRGGSTLKQILSDLSALGFPIVLDDFGSGLTLFQQLRDLPLTAVKVDGSVVKNALLNEPDRRLFEALVGLAHTLGLKVVAEHVEDEKCRDMILGVGADYAQGFLFGRPVELEAPPSI